MIFVHEYNKNNTWYSMRDVLVWHNIINKSASFYDFIRSYKRNKIKFSRYANLPLIFYITFHKRLLVMRSSEEICKELRTVLFRVKLLCEWPPCILHIMSPRIYYQETFTRRTFLQTWSSLHNFKKTGNSCYLSTLYIRYSPHQSSASWIMQTTQSVTIV